MKNNKTKKKTGVFRAALITVLTVLFVSFFFKAISIIVAAIFARLGMAAIYIGVAVNVAGAALAAWAGARLATVGREFAPGKAIKAAVAAAVSVTLIDMASGLTGDVLAVMSGRFGYYTSTLIQGAGFFIAVFFVARVVFGKREEKITLAGSSVSG